MSALRAAAKLVGIFDAGTRNVELYIREGRDAEFHLQPEKNQQAKITLGTADYKWWEIMSNLTHEITEFVLTDMGLRYAPAPDISQDNGNYYFAMSHTQFSEVTARVGLFLSEAMPVLRRMLKGRK
jgi:hypothetical protein